MHGEATNPASARGVRAASGLFTDVRKRGQVVIRKKKQCANTVKRANVVVVWGRGDDDWAAGNEEETLAVKPATTTTSQECKLGKTGGRTQRGLYWAEGEVGGEVGR